MCLCGDTSTSNTLGMGGNESRVLHVGSTNRVPPEVLGRHFKHLSLLIYMDIKVLVANFVTNSLA